MFIIRVEVCSRLGCGVGVVMVVGGGGGGAWGWWCHKLSYTVVLWCSRRFLLKELSE